MKAKFKTLFLFFIFSSLFLLRTDLAFCQDPVKVEDKNRTGVSIGVGLPSGITLFVHQQVFPSMYIDAGVGFMLIGYSYDAGMRFKIGGDSSNQVIGVRYTNANFASFHGGGNTEYGILSAWYGLFDLRANETPFNFGIGANVPLGDRSGIKFFNSYIFAEVGIRLFSF